MAEKGEKRDPKSHRTPTQVRRLARGYNHRPSQVRKREMRNHAREMLAEEGLVHKGDGMDVDHKRPLRDGGSNKRSNLRVRPSSVNRAWRLGIR